jgi:hypothetical protein
MYEHTYTQDDTSNVPTLQSSAMLIDLHIGAYTGSKSDNQTRDEVTVAKRAGSKRAHTVRKHLFAGDADLDAINTYIAQIRKKLLLHTLPWADSGTRMLSTKSFFELSALLSSWRVDYYQLVDRFVDNFNLKVSNAAFALGSSFDRDEYPTADQVRSKFTFSYVFSPVPSAGDLRVDLPAEALDVVRAQYAKVSDQRIEAATKDAWDRVLEMARYIKAKVTTGEDGKRPRIYESSLEQAKELTEVLVALNITNDPELEAARLALKNALDPVDCGSLRESDEVRDSVRSKMDALLSKFDY